MKLRKIISDLDFLQCQAVQIRFFNEICLDYLKSVINLFSDTTILYVEIYVKMNDGINLENLEKVLKSYLRLRHIVLYNSPIKTIYKADGLFGGVECITDTYIDVLNCGRVEKNTSQRISAILLKRKNHNTCLNRKVSIDVNGNIKNCPSMMHSYGNVSVTNIRQVVLEKKFPKVLDFKQGQYTYL